MKTRISTLMALAICWSTLAQTVDVASTWAEGAPVNAPAGGEPVTTVQDGNWSDGAVWDVGRPPIAALGEEARVNHVVSVTTTGAETNLLGVGVDSQGAVSIESGDLTVQNPISVGTGSFGVLNMNGGLLVAPGLAVGDFSNGVATLRGGVLDLASLSIGFGSQTGRLIIDGGGATANVSGPCDLRSTGTLVLRPTGSGAAGLSRIDVVDWSFETQSTIELEVVSYEPSQGDVWEIIRYSGTRTGTAANVVAPPGYSIVVEEAVPGVVTVRVTDAPGDCGLDVQRNHDGTFENAYTWEFEGAVEPDYGAFAEQFEGRFDICEVRIHLTQVGNQAGQTIDVTIWQDDDTDNPGAVIAQLTEIDPGPIATWPAVSLHEFPIATVVEGKWWVGCRGNWPGAQAGWLVAGDETATTDGMPRTNIAPGQNYPIGWEHPNIVGAWSASRSLGIEVVGTISPVAVSDPFANGTHGAPGPVLRVSPNPFSGSTAIAFDVDQEPVTLSIFDVQGRLVRSFLPGHIEGRALWDGRTGDGHRAAAGVYVVRIETADGVQRRKIVKMR